MQCSFPVSPEIPRNQSSRCCRFSMFYYTVLVVFLLMHKEGLAITFTVMNKCDYTVWPGILSNAGSSGFGTTGFELPPRAARSLQAPPGWSGRFWGRTGCFFDPVTGQGTCATGDCGSSQVECNGRGAEPPATLAEFTIGAGAQDFYDVSLVDGYNLPMIVEPVSGSGVCGATGCAADLNRLCPSELRAAEGQACSSACKAFGTPEYCCSGEYGSPATCRPSMYSATFKSACPRAYSYAYDDATSTFTCNGADYTITFCPLLTSQKSSRDTGAGTASLPVAAGGGAAAVGYPPPLRSDLPWLHSLFASSDTALKPYPNFGAPSAAAFLLLPLLLLGL